MLNPDFKDMLSCLNNEEAKFIIVGAYALAAHGLPRATGDIDIWVENSPGNAQKIMRALARFGAPISHFSEVDLVSPDRILQLGVEPCRIDLLTSIDGVEFGAAWKNRMTITTADMEVFVLSKADLLKNKLAANRDKDKSDIAWLEKN
jgi:hypothetical protein